jgi:uncharacterized protein YjdB
MKQLFFLFFTFCWLHAGAQGKYVDRVIEFLPAPGQFTNEGGYPAYSEGADAALMAERATAILRKNAGNTSNNMSTISLGAYGGYIILGFDHPIYNRPYAYDFKIHGNMFDGNSEPGIVMVSKDVNKNGLPDDPWYELAGSEYYSSETTHHYEIQYFRPNPLNGDVKWKDNQGREGKVLRNTYHQQTSYYPLWYAEDTLTFRGTLISLNAWNTVQPPNQYWRSEAFAWGYADNQANAGELTNFSLDWAVDVNGNPVTLDQVDFIKIYTAVIQDAGWLGETSAEFSQAEDLHPDYSFPPTFKSSVHIVTELPEAAKQAVVTDGFADFSANWDEEVLKGGFTVNSKDGIASSGLKAAGKEEGEPYLIGVCRQSNEEQPKTVVTFSDGLAHGLCGMYVNNTTETISFLQQQQLNKGDYIKLVAKGLDKEGNYTGNEVSFNLADYSFTNSVMNYSVEKWVWMELEALGSVSGIEFSLLANRPEICPDNFCMKELTISIIPIKAHPLPQTLCEAEACTLSAAFGETELTYQWYKNEKTIDGATSDTLHIAAVGLADIGNYYCIAKDPDNNHAQTNSAYVDVFEPLSVKIKGDADTLYVHVGDTVNLKTEVTGNSMLPRWSRGKTMLNTSQNPTAWSQDMTIPDFSLADQNSYHLRVSGECAASGTFAYSDTVYVKVIFEEENQPLEITRQPTDAEILYGKNGVFEIETSIPALYTWQYQKSNGTWASIDGSFANQSVNKPRLNMTASTQEAFLAPIRCMVQNEDKSITLYSDTVKVVHLQSLQFIQPASISYGATHTEFSDKMVTMEVEALDFEPSAYQWYFRASGTDDYVLLTGEIRSIYRLGTYLTASDAGQYRCEVTGPQGVSSIYYSLSVEVPIPATAIINTYTPHSRRIVGGSTVKPNGIVEEGENVYIRLDGNTTLESKWLKDGKEIEILKRNVTNNSEAEAGEYFMGKGKTSLYIKEITSEHIGTYQLVLSDGVQEWKSALIKIMINPEEPEIRTDLEPLTVNEDETFDLVADVDGKSLDITYQWHFNGNPIQGGTKSTHVTTGPDKKQYSLIAKPANSGYYYYTATTVGGAVTSKVVFVTVNPKAVITAHPADQLVLKDHTATFSIAAQGEDLSYQWLKDGVELQGETASSLTIENVDLANEGAYTCEVVEPGKLTATSGKAYLNVIERPVISGHILCNNEPNTILTVQTQYKNTPLRYQWYKNGTLLTGATSTWLTVSDVANEAYEYYCRVTNSNHNIVSETVKIVSGQAPEFTADLKEQHVAVIDDPVSLSVIGSGSAQYQWYKDGVALQDENQAALLFSAVKPDDEADYYCIIRNSCGQKASTTLRLTVNPILVESIALNESTYSLEEGEQFQLQASLLPENATNKKVLWSSNDEAIATVDQNGLVTAVEIGEATIQATAEEGGIAASCTISVLSSQTVGVESNTANTLTVYPTMTTGIIYLETSSSEEVSVIDIIGKVRMNVSLVPGKQVLNLAELLPGVYFIKTHHTTIKIILNEGVK